MQVRPNSPKSTQSNKATPIQIKITPSINQLKRTQSLSGTPKRPNLKVAMGPDIFN